MLARVHSLVVKEFLAVWSDKKSRVILIVPPLVQMLIFTFAATQEVTNVPIAILNKSSGHAARDLGHRALELGRDLLANVRFAHASAPLRAVFERHVEIGLFDAHGIGGKLGGARFAHHVRDLGYPEHGALHAFVGRDRFGQGHAGQASRLHQ